METIQIHEDGTKLAYLDSGAPPRDDYTTIVCVHGHTYHANSFSKLFPLAPQYNIRIIALNRRDYTGSTPFSRDELDVLNGRDSEAQKKFLHDRGLEIARFLASIIKEKKIPRSAGSSGGLALLGWSLGNLTTFAFLGHLNSFPTDLVETLEPYLRTFLIYESALQALGYPYPPGSYGPLVDKSIPPALRGITFGVWTSSYYSHPVYKNGIVPPIEDRSFDALKLRTPTRKERTRPCTLDTIPADELSSIVDPAPGPRSEQAFWDSVSPQAVHDQLLRAILLDRLPNIELSSECANLLPRLKMVYVYGLASLWSIQWAAWEFERDVAKLREGGHKIRPLEIVIVPDTNHFMFWDLPEKFLKIFSDAMRSCNWKL